MTRRIMDFGDPDRFIVGTVGEPGRRTFFLQAVQGPRVASVALEKAQVAVLADRLIAVVAELERRGLAATAAGLAEDDRPLDEPLREEFRVGTLTIAWDDDVDRLVVEARSMEPEDAEDANRSDPAEGPSDTDTGAGTGRFGGFMVVSETEMVGASEDAEDEDEDEDEDVADDSPLGPDVLRVRISAAMAQGFARRALRVVAAGRPACPFCGLPIERTGHLCPRRNGADYVH